MTDIEAPKQVKSLFRRVLLAVILAILAMAAFYTYEYGIPASLANTGSLLSQTLRDVLGFGTSRKLAAEIDLSGRMQSGEYEPTSSTEIAPSVGKHQESSQFPSERPRRKDKSLDTAKSISVPTFDSASSGLAPTEKVSTENNDLLVCDFTAKAEPNHKVILNEIAWMGSPPQNGETAAQSSNREWLELKNNFGQEINLSDWQILNKSEKFKIVFGAGEKLGAGELYLLERGDDDSVRKISADKIYSGALSNSGEWLRIFDNNCALVDELDNSFGWKGGDNGTKQTFERNVTNLGWHTSANSGGTPKMQNSNVIEGDPPPAVVATSSADLNQSQATTTSQNNSALTHLVIAAVQIAGASSTNDFIKIFNPTSAPLDIGGWKLRKRTSSGSEYSVRVFPSGSAISPSGYFVWANSAGGFSVSIAADASSTETLAADNSVALLDGSSTIVDKVAWGEGANQFVESSAYPASPTANQILLRKYADGVIQDTDNNAVDFSIQ